MKWSFSYYFSGGILERPMENIKGNSRHPSMISFLQGGPTGELCEITGNCMESLIGWPDADITVAAGLEYI